MKRSEVEKNSKVRDLLDDITEKLRTIYGGSLHSVIVYGSYARGGQSDESDIDIMVLLNADEDTIKLKNIFLMETVATLSLEHGIIVSIIEQSYEKYMQYIEYVPFYSNVNREGMNIYERKNQRAL
ncbi:MAG TPA: nucleotidyltransferase domain-containing protein [Spirochaetota bacterium]|nr:nucleotidyltransferase domain-containing protein [Spirochaetota bacterium]